VISRYIAVKLRLYVAYRRGIRRQKPFGTWQAARELASILCMYLRDSETMHELFRSNLFAYSAFGKPFVLFGLAWRRSHLNPIQYFADNAQNALDAGRVNF
jgi:hypothetical protein